MGGQMEKNAAAQDSVPQKQELLVFASYAETGEQLNHIVCLAESVRAFSGKFRDAPIWIFMPQALYAGSGAILEKLFALGVKARTTETPDEALWFYYAGKTYASGVAEIEAEGKAEILVWMDDDTIVLSEPSDFSLKRGISFGYRPVMHNRSGSRVSSLMGTELLLIAISMTTSPLSQSRQIINWCFSKKGSGKNMGVFTECDVGGIEDAASYDCAIDMTRSNITDKAQIANLI
jgi:hypothetical protein